MNKETSRLMERIGRDNIAYLFRIARAAIKMRKGLTISSAWQYGVGDTDLIDWEAVKKFDKALGVKS